MLYLIDFISFHMNSFSERQPLPERPQRRVSLRRLGRAEHRGAAALEILGPAERPEASTRPKKALNLLKTTSKAFKTPFKSNLKAISKLF